MKRYRTAPLAVMALLAAAAISAGETAEEEHVKRCKLDVSACIREMADQAKQRGWIGIEFESPANPVIQKVVAGSPAEAGGVRIGDLWVGLNDFRFAGLDEKEAMRRVKEAIQPGVTIGFWVERAGEVRELRLAPSAVPPHILAQWVGQHVLDYHLEDPAGGEG